MRTVSNYDLSDHAERRAQQRGVSLDTMNFVITHADVWLHAGEGRRTARISQRQLGQLSREGVPAALIERATNVVMLIDPVAGIIVTVLHDHGSRSGRMYRSQWPTRSRKWRRHRQWQKQLTAISLYHYQTNQKKPSIH